MQPPYLFLATICLFLVGCDQITPNNPYPSDESTKNIFYASFSERPKYLDPAHSYSSDESVFTAQIYEPPLQYAYIPGVYELIPATAVGMPKITYLSNTGDPIDGEKFPEQVAETQYEISIKPNILYQPHPAFAKNEQGQFLYHHLDNSNIKSLQDFPHKGTRELTAEDYVYEIKRLAWSRINSPIYELMSKKIIGLEKFHDEVEELNAGPEQFKTMNIEGVTVLDTYTYQIRIQGIYSQFIYWLAMPFFAPIPWEADIFYDQAELIEKNIVMDWYPVGTGPYMLEENNPNKQMVLIKNPNYRDEFYNNKKIPQIDKAIYSLEKEAIPGWNKFLQGYYDASGVDSDNFATAIQFVAGQSEITPALAQKGITLIKEVELANFYWGFNMHDETLGGYSDKNQKLRQALSLAINIPEYIEIFLNGRGLPASFILPPGIFGYSTTSNPYQNKTLENAKQLLSEAGYPNGRDEKTNEPLIIHFDTTSGGGPQDQAADNWMRKQFKKLGIDLDVRATDYNRFREKLDNGTFQFFSFGWVGDYPDPENFLFLLYGPNGKAHHDGVNSTNYNNEEFNILFEKMNILPNNPERAKLIDEMRTIAQQDAPMVWGFYPESYILKHAWLKQVITNEMVRNGLKYYVIDGDARAQARANWNAPRLMPILIVLGIILLFILPIWFIYQRKETRSTAKRFQ